MMLDLALFAQAILTLQAASSDWQEFETRVDCSLRDVKDTQAWDSVRGSFATRDRPNSLSFLFSGSNSVKEKEYRVLEISTWEGEGDSIHWTTSDAVPEAVALKASNRPTYRPIISFENSNFDKRLIPVEGSFDYDYHETIQVIDGPWEYWEGHCKLRIRGVIQ